jgi:spore germination protein YaaH
MPSRRPPLAAIAALFVAAALVGANWQPIEAGVAAVTPSFSSSGRVLDDRPSTAPDPTPVPIPGHEVYGYVPYWEMDGGIVRHVAGTALTTIGLFSVTHRKDGSLAASENGYRKVTGPIGRQLASDARKRGVRAELVYSSFGYRKNDALFASSKVQDRTIAGLAGLVEELRLDGVNIDVEQLEPHNIPAYGQFVGRLRKALVARRPDAQVSVATTSGRRGAAMALAATASGAERVFIMGYDYHWSGSEPGASAPLDRRDGEEKDLPWTLDVYAAAGVPADRTILGLPLYGMSWPVSDPGPGAGKTGKGSAWIPRRNVDELRAPSAPTYDPLEGVEVITRRDGNGWRAIYFDSPASLTPKLALADDRGLAGAGFWALGYERGLPDYGRLIAEFHAGKLKATLAP